MQMYVDSKIIVMHELSYNEEDFAYCVTVTSIQSYLEKEIVSVVALLVPDNAKNISRVIGNSTVLLYY